MLATVAPPPAAAPAPAPAPTPTEGALRESQCDRHSGMLTTRDVFRLPPALSLFFPHFISHLCWLLSYFCNVSFYHCEI